ncbi:hypothetical protein ACI68E_001491 [Malassezia pachydermatis]
MKDTLLLWCGSVPASYAASVLDESGTPAKDDDLSATATYAADRAPSSLTARHGIEGRLADDWSVAMKIPGSASTGTTLYPSTHTMSLGIAQRLSAKLGVAQVYVSLDLPDSFAAPSHGMPMPPEDARALQAMELGLRRVGEAMHPYTQASSEAPRPSSIDVRT